MTGDQLLDIPVEDILPDPDNPRKCADDDELRALGESMLTTGQQQPITVYADGCKYRLITGHRRLGGAKLMGMKTLMGVLMAKPAGGMGILGQIAENKARKCLTPMEDVESVARAKRENPGMTSKEIAAHTGFSESDVSKCLAISDCLFTIAAMADSALSLSEAYAVAKAAPDEKQGLVNMKKSGAPSAQITKSRKPRGDSVKADRTTIQMPGGVKVQVSGPELDLDGLIDALSATLDAAKRAKKDYLNIKTFAKVSADKARAS